MRDIHNNVKVSIALVAAIIDSDTTTVGATIDTQGFESLEFAAMTGALADGAFAGALYHDNDPLMATETLVLAADLLGTVPAFTSLEGSTIKKAGYKGAKRYVRLKVASTTTTDGGIVGAIAVQSNPRNAPVA